MKRFLALIAFLAVIFIAKFICIRYDQKRHSTVVSFNSTHEAINNQTKNNDNSTEETTKQQQKRVNEEIDSYEKMYSACPGFSPAFPYHLTDESN